MNMKASDSVGQEHRPLRSATYVVTGSLAIAAIVGVVVFGSYQHDMQAARDRLANIPTQIYKSTYGDIEYYLVGSGPTVLISHGVTGGVDQGIGLSTSYLGDGYRFLYVSRFGYLKSSMPRDASSRKQAAAYKELLDYLGIDSVFVLGNSAGGPSAMYFAIDYPEKCRGLILVSSATPGAEISSPPKIVFQSDFIYWLVTKVAAKSLMKIFIPSSVMETLTRQETEKIVNGVFTASLPISERSTGIVFDNEVSTRSVDGIPFAQIRVPSLIIHAVDDPAPPIAGAREIAAKMPNSRLVTFDGGHLLLHHEDEVKEEIRNFIEKNR